MTISWTAWERLRDSLDYSWERLQELDPLDNPADREEYEALAEAAIALASRLLQSSGNDVPALHVAAAREQWFTWSRKASVMRERIVEHRRRVESRLEDAESGLAG